MGVGEAEHVLRRPQAAVGERLVALVEVLVAEGEGGGEASCEVGAHGSTGWPRAEHGAVADEAVQRVFPAEAVVRLRQAPDVVVAGCARVALADAHLVVERARFVVPHPQQPFDPEARLAGEVRAARALAHRAGKSRMPASITSTV